jgi:serine/threonine protein kinase
MKMLSTPADHLSGTVLKSGWEIGQRLTKPAGASGGTFGICYAATKGPQSAFVKALDFRRAFLESDVVAALHSITSELLWEKSLMELARDASMSRVVRLLDYEEMILPQDAGDSTKRISILVFETGEGDLRRKFDLTANPRFSWRLRVLRDVALALDQLHRSGVAHLDVKPSNVICMPPQNDRDVMKLADLGRAVRKGVAGPFDSVSWPGDFNYAPPEKFYGLKNPDWINERESGDAYLLGSLFVFLSTGISMTSLLFNEIPESFKFNVYRGQYDEQLIDVLRQAQARVLALHVFPALPSVHREEMEVMIKELTDPDPKMRGEKNARRAGIIGIDRYHQKLQRIERRVALAEAQGSV